MSVSKEKVASALGGSCSIESDACNSEKGSRLNTEIHPFENDAILHHLFQVCSSDQLRVFRLVSRKWYNISLDAWRQPAVLRIKLNEDEKEKASFYRQLGRFNKLESKHFQCIAITNLGDEDEGKWEKIWNIFVPEKVTFLELENVCLEVSMFREQLLHRMANLVSLKLKSVVIFDKNAESSMDEEMDEVEEKEADYSCLSHCKLRNLKVVEVFTEGVSKYDRTTFYQKFIPQLPKLESLTVEYYMQDRNYQGGREPAGPIFLNDIFEYFSEKEISLNLKNLDILKLDGEFSERNTAKTIESLTNAQLPLEVLRMDLGSKTSLKAITSFLAQYSTTLKKFQGYRDPTDVIVRRPKLPERNVMESLEDLQLVERLNTALQLLTIIGTPNLKMLRLETSVPEESKTIRLRGGSDKTKTVEDPIMERISFWKQIHLLKLEYLCIEQLDVMQPFSSKEIEFMGGSMPNLRNLSLSTGKEGFSTVCKTWRKLNLLKIYGGPTSSDFGLVPIDDESLTGIYKFGKEKKKSSSHGSLIDMKDLTDFTLQVQTEPGAIPLSDEAVFKGFLLLPRLFQLGIYLKKFSPKALVELERKVQIEYPEYFQDK